MSIRRHLLLWLLGALSIGAMLLAIATYAFALDEMNEVSDEQLKQVAFAVLSNVALTDQASPAPSASADDLNGYAFVTQVWNLQGERLSVSTTHISIPFSSDEGFQTISTPVGEWRVYTDRSATRLIQTAQSIAVRQEFAVDVALKILIPSLLGSPFVAMLLVFALRKGLDPLRGTAEDIRSRSSTSMEPLAVAKLPLELQPVVESFNQLLAKLGAAMTAQRRLIADAAHELRTPLTALRLQTQAFATAANETARATAADDTQQVLDRATHLVEQLLALSRADPDTLAAEREPIDLGELVKAVVTSFSQVAEKRWIDLGADVQATTGDSLITLGNREQLQIMLNNLVDNALRYTPSGGRVDVIAEASGSDEIRIAVADSGPGLPADERDRIFDRFYRGSTARASTTTQGSGLGLAIVKAAAMSHDARVDVCDGLRLDASSPGLTIRVSLKRLADAQSFPISNV
jgi:two-component system OmpR family sensor kinase